VPQLPDELRIVLVTRRELPMLEDERFDPRMPRAIEACCLRTVGNDNGDSRREMAVAGRVDQRLKVASPAGDQDPEPRQVLS
jgi:hypothetical protein